MEARCDVHNVNVLGPLWVLCIKIQIIIYTMQYNECWVDIWQKPLNDFHKQCLRVEAKRRAKHKLSVVCHANLMGITDSETGEKGNLSDRAMESIFKIEELKRYHWIATTQPSLCAMIMQ